MNSDQFILSIKICFVHLDWFNDLKWRKNDVGENKQNVWLKRLKKCKKTNRMGNSFTDDDVVVWHFVWQKIWRRFNEIVNCNSDLMFSEMHGIWKYFFFLHWSLHERTLIVFIIIIFNRYRRNESAKAHQTL